MCRGSSVLRGFELCLWGAFIPPVPAEDTWEGWAPKLGGVNSINTEGAEYTGSRKNHGSVMINVLLLRG